MFELCKNAPEWYLQADYEKKRELLKLMYSNFLYDGQKPHFELNSVFKLMFDLSKNEKIVVKLQPLELFDKNNLTQNNTVSNIYQRIVLVMKESTQEYYNMRMVLGLECA